MSPGDLTDTIQLAVLLVVIFGIPAAGKFAKTYLDHRERMVQAQFGGQSTEIANLRQEIAQLRLELSTLRDTSTQYDMSIQSNIDEIQHRLTTVETRARAAQSEPQLTRTVGRTE